MHPQIRRLGAALVLALPLAVAASAAVALDTSATELALAETAASNGPVLADTPVVDHDEMSDSEHAASLESEHGEMSDSEHEATLEPEHAEMSDSEHAATLEPEHGEMSDSEHADSVEDAHTSAGGSRPRSLVLGSFGLVNAGVVVSAAVLRRRAPDRHKRRPVARDDADGTLTRSEDH